MIQSFEYEINSNKERFESFDFQSEELLEENFLNKVCAQFEEQDIGTVRNCLL